MKTKAYRFLLDCETDNGNGPNLLYVSHTAYAHDAVDEAKARVSGVTRVVGVVQVDHTPRPVNAFRDQYVRLGVKTNRVV